MPDRERLRRRLEEQTARDHTRLRHWRERREGRIQHGMDAPVWPALCRLCMVGMIGGTALMVSGDFFTAWPNVARGMKNAAASGLWTWSAFALPLMGGSLWQLKRGFDHPWYAAHRLNRWGQARMPFERKYKLWSIIAAAGMVMWLIVDLAVGD